MELEAGGVQRRVALVGEGTADSAPIAAAHLGFRGGAGCDLTCTRAHATQALFAGFFRRAIGFIDGLSGLAYRMNVAQWVGPHGQGVLPGLPAGALAIPDNRHTGHTQGLCDSEPALGQLGVGSRQHALGQQDVAGEAGADAPQDCMAHVGLHALEGQDDPDRGAG